MKSLKLFRFIVSVAFIMSSFNTMALEKKPLVIKLRPILKDVELLKLPDGTEDEEDDTETVQHIAVKTMNPANAEANQGLSNWSWYGAGYVGVATNSDTLGSSSNVFRAIEANSSEYEYDALTVEQVLTLSSTDIDMIKSGEIDSVRCLGWFDFAEGSQGYAYFYIITLISNDSSIIDNVSITLQPKLMDSDIYQVLDFANLTKGSKVANTIRIRVQANDGALIDFDDIKCSLYRTEYPE